jgi:hypothetical protein
MRAILFCAAVAIVAPVRAEEKAPAPDVEGKWLIVYVEEGGKRNATWEQQVATIKGDTVKYSKDGNDRSLKLSFGAGQTVKATATDGGKETGEQSGVYIAGQDYLCLSFNVAGKDPKDNKGSSGSFIIILRKQR